MSHHHYTLFFIISYIYIYIIIGICQQCEQLNIDPLEDVRVLVLLWKLGANKKPAEIQKEEWIAGCHKLQIDSIDKFKKLLPSLDTGFMDREDFNDFYKVCVYLFWCVDWGGGVVIGLHVMFMSACLTPIPNTIS